MKLKIVSDGTNAGTKLIDEDTGEMIHLIQKLTWEADVKNFSTKVTVELLNIPVEIVSKVDVELLDYNKETWTLETSKFFEKEVKIVTEGNKADCLHVRIYDKQTNEPVGAVQKIKWTATPKKVRAKLKRIKFDNKDW